QRSIRACQAASGSACGDRRGGLSYHSCAMGDRCGEAAHGNPARLRLPGRAESVGQRVLLAYRRQPTQGGDSGGYVLPASLRDDLEISRHLGRSSNPARIAQNHVRLLPFSRQSDPAYESLSFLTALQKAIFRPRPDRKIRDPKLLKKLRLNPAESVTHHNQYF